eukprot:TRINITY_DN6055_c0_g1_i3.p1 TRINITY_DN6055_c0_g1~~TRINITY_DN6055_c0_g1_i3.p1  ORF type:complete len:144 (-),score=49.03 TRINITY_DN6055_c0_g1_i3:156-587(-)
MDFFQEVWDRKACILSNAGWLDSEGNIDDSAIMSDIDSLAPALSNSLADTKDLCMNRSMDATLENLFASEEFGAHAVMPEDEDDECVPEIDPEQLLEVEIVLQKLAFFRCVHENFMDGCGNYILEAVQSMMMGMVDETTTVSY